MESHLPYTHFSPCLCGWCLDHKYGPSSRRVGYIFTSFFTDWVRPVCKLGRLKLPKNMSVDGRFFNQTYINNYVLSTDAFLYGFIEN